MRRSPIQIFVLVLCVVALLGAQVFGGPLRFFCDCNGRMVVTQAAHCFGPDHSHCHTDGDGRGAAADAASAAENSHDGQDPAQRKEHQLAKDEVQVRPGDAGAPMVVAAPVWVAILPALAALYVAPEPEQSWAWAVVSAGDSPPSAGVAVARTVVFLI